LIVTIGTFAACKRTRVISGASSPHKHFSSSKVANMSRVAGMSVVKAERAKSAEAHNDAR